MNRKILAIFILTSSIVLGASAQSRILPILEANPDIRTAAMGNTMLGSTNQMYIYSNPAALTFGPRRLSIDASTIAYPKSEDGRLMQYVASAGYKFANRSALLAGVRYQGGLTVQPAQHDLALRFNHRPRLFVRCCARVGRLCYGHLRQESRRDFYQRIRFLGGRSLPESLSSISNPTDTPNDRCPTARPRQTGEVQRYGVAL